jgi:hypothetical protein
MLLYFLARQRNSFETKQVATFFFLYCLFEDK